MFCSAVDRAHSIAPSSRSRRIVSHSSPISWGLYPVMKYSASISSSAGVSWMNLAHSMGRTSFPLASRKVGKQRFPTIFDRSSASHWAHSRCSGNLVLLHVRCVRFGALPRLCAHHFTGAGCAGRRAFARIALSGRSRGARDNPRLPRRVL